jgi:hypothetical protein
VPAPYPRFTYPPGLEAYVTAVRREWRALVVVELGGTVSSSPGDDGRSGRVAGVPLPLEYVGTGEEVLPLSRVAVPTVSAGHSGQYRLQPGPHRSKDEVPERAAMDSARVVLERRQGGAPAARARNRYRVESQ